ncbi:MULTISPECIES: hypothetical protein [Streptomyces]|uniref:Uncharacterized protein n=1 Tax=Streptomyces mutomycini TaxID=284036 RepID=A0ABW0B8L4_9ACTN|nr:MULTISPECIES: hypothetical protein [Streptomyces]
MSAAPTAERRAASLEGQFGPHLNGLRESARYSSYEDHVREAGA